MENKMSIGEGKTKKFDYILTFNKKKIIMTEEEFNGLNEAYEAYIKEHGVTFGFMRHLLHGVGKVD